ncbi:NtaA/DmoA family FMN-dependent monooxygenase [Pseudomonas sp. NPDC007930]|uniref:LLM class flavin-dependent oxidoreductase n=1 Tax=Pseudomonas sp. NPDC007930 TaxID=3364417 RepID=UPI0036EDB0F5
MPANKQILLNAFNMNCVGHINHGLWTHPRDRSADYHRLSYWTSLAQLLEKGLFDGLFLADILGVYDVYRGNVALPLQESIQLPVNDPMMLVSAMAGATTHLGFGLTGNLSYELPYLFARRLSTLDHLTEGRVGWNIVTGYLDSAARAMGRPAQVAHDRRYDQADEYLQVLYKLWEGSWEDGAVLADRGTRVYAQPGKVHRIEHRGEFYQVDGYHLCEPSPQRTPVLFQAGSSGRGVRFAGQHAECVFISSQDRAATTRQVAAIREAARQAGRDPQAVKVFMGISVVTAASEAEARDKHGEYLRYASPEAGLAHYSASTGIDLARFGLDEPIRFEKTNAIESAQNTLAAHPGWTVRQLLEQNALGGRYPALVGSGAQVAEQLLGWVDDTGIDGFNLTRIVTPESYADFIAHVTPELQSRGRFKSAYAEGTLRHKLLGAGPRLPANHPGSGYRQLNPR